MVTKTVAAYNASQSAKDAADYVCDGTDDQAEIQAAINALSANGGTVQLTEGVFNCSGNVLPTTNITVRGQGVSVTAIRFKNDGILRVDAEYVVLENFKVEGTGYNASYDFGVVYIRSSHVVVRDVVGTSDATIQGLFYVRSVGLGSKDIEDIEFTRVVAESPGTYGFIHSSWGTDYKTHRNVRYTDCRATNCGLNSRYNAWVTGFDFAELNDIDGLQVVRCIAEGTWESGFHFEYSPVKKNVVFTDCIARNNGKKPFPPYYDLGGEYYFGGGFFCAKGEYKFYNCLAERNSAYGFFFSYPDGVYLYDCVERETGYGKTDFSQVKPTGYFYVQSQQTAANPSVRMENCESDGSLGRGLYATLMDYVQIVNFTMKNPGGIEGVGALIGDPSLGTGFTQCNVEIHASGNGVTNLVKITDATNSVFSGSIVSNVAVPFLVTGWSTNGVQVQNIKTTSTTLAVGSSGIATQNVNAGAVTVTNCTVVRPTPVKTVAASNTPAAKKATANYICDGTGDQEEINAAISSGAYDILLYEGTYNVTGNLQLRGGKVFSGEGRDKTFIKLKMKAIINLDNEYTTIQDLNVEGTGYGSDFWSGLINIRASHCTAKRITGTADNTPGCVFHTNSSTVTPGTSLQDVEWNACEAVDTGTYGFLHNWWENQPSKRTHTNIRYINCKAIRCGNANGTASKGQRNPWVVGFDFAEGNDITNLYVKGCYAEGNWESGFHMEWDPTKINCVLEDCVSKFNGAKPTYPNETVNPFYGFKTNTGEFFGSGYYFPNMRGAMNRCYSEGNARCGFWVTNGAILTDCVDKDNGIGRTPNQYLQPMSFMGNPCKSAYEGYSLKLIRCKVINTRCYAFWYDYAAYIFMEDCEVYGGQGYNGVLNHFGSAVSNYFQDSKVNFARIECSADLTAVNAHQNIRVTYGPSVVVSDATKPFTVTGGSTNAVSVNDWTTVSQTLPAGQGGVTVEGGASAGQVTQNNVTITKTDPGGGTGGDPGEPEDPPIPPVDPPEQKDWLAGWKYRHPLLIQKEKITSSETDFPVAIFLNGSTGLNGVLTALGQNALKIAVTDASGSELSVEVVRWDTVGLLYVRVPIISQGVDTALYLYYDPDHADNTNYVGFTTDVAAEHVWESNFLAAWNGAKNPSEERMFDSTSNWKDNYLYNTYGGSYAVEADSEGRKGIKFSAGGYVDTMLAPAEINPAEAFTIEATVRLHSLNTGVSNQQMWFGQNSPLSARVYAAVYGLPPKWAFAVGNQPWGANDSPACTEELTHVMWTVNKSTQTAKLFVNGTLVETKTGWTWIDLDKNLIGGWAVAHEGAGSLNYASNITIYNIRAALVERSTNWVNIQAQSERNLLLTYYASEEAPTTPPPVTPGDWAFPDCRYRRAVLISGAELNNNVTDVPVRLPLIPAFSNSASPTTQRFYDRIGDKPLKLRAATEAGTPCWLSVTHWPSDDPNRAIMTGEAFLRAPVVEAKKINRFYVYYGADAAESSTTVRDGTRTGQEQAYEPHFRAVYNYAWNTASNDHIVQSVSKDPVLSDIGPIAGINTVRRIDDWILGSALDMRQILNLPFAGGSAFHNLTGALTVECHVKFINFPTAPVGEWKYCFPICKGYAADSGRSWTLAVRDNGTGYFFVRKPDDSGWVNNATAFGPIPTQQKVYIACVFDPNNKIRVHVLTESGNYSVFETAIPDVGASYRSEYQGGFNIPYGHGLFNGFLHHASISDVARSEDWIKLRALTLGDSIGSYVTIEAEEEQPQGTVDSRAVVAYVKKISAEALIPGGEAVRLAVSTVKPIVAEVSAFRRAETYQVVATVKKISASAYADVYGVTGAISYVGAISAFTEMIAHSGRVQVVRAFTRPIKGDMRSYGVVSTAAPDGPGVFAADDLQIEVRSGSGSLIAILDNAHHIRVVQEDNAPTLLEFDLPADDSKGSSLTLANEIWIRSVKTGGVVAKFKLHKKTDTRGV